MTDQGVVVLGISIPSASPIFLSIVAVHVAAGLVCTVAGIGAMSTPKRAGRHPYAGTVYYWSLRGGFPLHGRPLHTSVASEHTPLRARHPVLRRWSGRTNGEAAPLARVAPGPHHRHGGVVLLLLTAFYVDNGPHLPLWSSLPPLAYWVGPSLVGLPILVWALRRHTKMREAPAHRNRHSAHTELTTLLASHPLPRGAGRGVGGADASQLARTE